MKHETTSGSFLNIVPGVIYSNSSNKTNNYQRILLKSLAEIWPKVFITSTLIALSTAISNLQTFYLTNIPLSSYVISDCLANLLTQTPHNQRKSQMQMNLSQKVEPLTIWHQSCSQMKVSIVFSQISGHLDVFYTKWQLANRHFQRRACKT